MRLESTELTVQRAAVIVSTNPSATMSTDPALKDVLLDTRGPFVLNIVSLENMAKNVPKHAAIVAINPTAKMSTDSAQRDVLMDIRDSFVLSHANKRYMALIVHRNVVQTVAVKRVTL